MGKGRTTTRIGFPVINHACQDEDDIILSNDDERIESEKETAESGKTDENSDDEEEHVEEEYVHEANNVHDDVEKQDDLNVEIKDDEIAVENAQVKDDDQATTIVPVTQNEKPDVPPSSSSIFVSSDYAITTTVHDPLLAVIQRLSNLETKFEDWTKVDHSKVITKVVQTDVINEHGSQKDVSEIRTIKLEYATKQQLPKHSAKPFDQAAKAEFDQKEILFKMMRDFKSYEKHPTHQALYDALMLSIILDEDDTERAKAVESPTSKKR
uniref:Uncharacterized protein n=1 Tax=Tanacetum cinerariifolium TaxID=118510 RepID=A0A6L2JKT8_TANCI|nr:hypothetical protein [Tanacetum cinerariifolium]